MRTRPAVSAAAVLLATALATAGCTSSGSGGDPTSSPPASTTSSSPAPSSTSPSTSTSTSTDPAAAQAQLEQTLDGRWLEYWKVALSLAGSPRPTWPTQVKAVAAEPIYGELLNSVAAQLDGLGQVGYGYIKSRPYWPSPAKVGASKIVMGDCFDGSHAGSKIKKTGEIKTVGKPRTNVHVTLVLGSDRKWRVQQIEYLKASC